MKFIFQNRKELPKQLAQKDYNKAVIKKVETRLKQIQKIMQDYSDDEIEKIYTSMHKERQALVTPIEATWNQRIKSGMKEYDGKEFREGTADPDGKRRTGTFQVRKDTCGFFL